MINSLFQLIKMIKISEICLYKIISNRIKVIIDLFVKMNKIMFNDEINNIFYQIIYILKWDFHDYVQIMIWFCESMRDSIDRIAMMTLISVWISKIKIISNSIYQLFPKFPLLLSIFFQDDSESIKSLSNRLKIINSTWIIFLNLLKRKRFTIFISR